MARTRRYRFVECRAISHAWEQVEDDRSWKQFGVAMQFRCTRCFSIRRDVVSNLTGELLYRSYSKPDDYKLSRDQVGSNFNRADWRLAMLDERKKSRRRRSAPKLKIVS